MLSSNKKTKLYVGYLFCSLVCAFTLGTLLAPSVQADKVYPKHSSPGHQKLISARSGDWGPAPHGDSKFNCSPGWPQSWNSSAQTPGECATGLDAQETRYKLFKKNVGVITNDTPLIIKDGCKDVEPFGDAEGGHYHKKPNNPDKGARKIKVEIWKTQSNGALSGSAERTRDNYSGGDPTTCVGSSNNDLQVLIPKDAFTSNQSDRYGDDMLTALVVIRKQGGGLEQRGNKLFTLDYQYGDGVFGDDSRGDGVYFAQSSTNTSGLSTYTFTFKTDCRYKGGNVTFRIGDADWGDGTIVGKPSVSLYPEGAMIQKVSNITGGSGNKQFVRQLERGKKYILEIANIGHNNGLRFYLPFSEFEGYSVGSDPNDPNDDCADDPQPATPDCSTYRHNMGANSRYRFTVFSRDGNYWPTGSPSQGATVTGAGNRSWRFDNNNNNFMNNPNYVMQTELTTDSTPENDPNSFNFPEPKGPDWIVYVERWQRTNPNDPDPGTYKYGVVDNPIKVMNCFSAICKNMSVVEGALPGRANGVEAGKNFKIRLEIENTGQGDLPANTRGYNLTATDAGWSFVHGLGTGIPRGTTHPVEITLTAPTGRTNKGLSVYPDYNNLFALQTHAPEGERFTKACETTISTYERFKLEPIVDSVISNDDEYPTEVKSNTSIDQIHRDNDGTIYTSALIPATSTRVLELRRGGATIANLIGPHSDSRGFSNPDPYTYPDVYNNSSITRDDFQAGDQLCASITISVDDGWIGPSDDVVDRDGQARTSPEQCERVVDRPFVRMYGSDVFAGGKFGEPGAGTNGDIKTYIKRATNVPESSSWGAGSGVEFAAFALGVIEKTGDQSKGFTSASLRSSAPNAPSGLSFASPGSGFGGNFASTRMATDYFNATKRPETKLPTGTSQNVNDLVDRQQSGFTPPDGVKFRLNGGTDYSRHHSLYVDGDVFISGDITYANSGNWTTLGAIPSFGLYVKGNIYISASVTRLDGLYVAQPNDGTGGKIYTCSTPSDGSLYGESQIYNACRSQLKVNGAFIAQETKLLRTAYTLSDVPVTSMPVPGVGSEPAFAGIDDGAYAQAVSGHASTRANRSKCVTFVEPADPNWAGNDNIFCYNSTHTLKWYHGGPGGAPAAGEQCEQFNNPAESDSHTWNDNYLCAPAGSGVQLKLIYDGSNPTGMQCTPITESNWAAGEPGGVNPWANVKLCYRASFGGSPGTNSVPLQYAKETFANDHAAESFRLAPEMFLAPNTQLPTGSQSNGKFDQYLSLPPIL